MPSPISLAMQSPKRSFIPDSTSKTTRKQKSALSKKKEVQSTAHTVFSCLSVMTLLPIFPSFLIAPSSQHQFHTTIHTCNIHEPSPTSLHLASLLRTCPIANPNHSQKRKNPTQTLQTRPDQTRSDPTRPDPTIIHTDVHFHTLAHFNSLRIITQHMPNRQSQPPIMQKQNKKRTPNTNSRNHNCKPCQTRIDHTHLVTPYPSHPNAVTSPPPSPSSTHKKKKNVQSFIPTATWKNDHCQDQE